MQISGHDVYNLGLLDVDEALIDTLLRYFKMLRDVRKKDRDVLYLAFRDHAIAAGYVADEAWAHSILEDGDNEWVYEPETFVRVDLDADPDWGSTMVDHLHVGPNDLTWIGWDRGDVRFESPTFSRGVVLEWLERLHQLGGVTRPRLLKFLKKKAA